MALLLSTVRKFADFGLELQWFMEGKKVLAADHPIIIGLKDFNDERVQIVTLCIQTSSLFGELHQISFFKNKEPFKRASC